MMTSVVWALLGFLFAPGAMGSAPRPLLHAAPPPSLMTVAVPHGAPPPSHPAKGRLLIAGRKLADPNFSETVVLLLTYGDHGAMGLVINRQTDVRLASALPQVLELRDQPDRVFVGGPVAGNVLVLLIRSGQRPEGSEPIFGDVYATGSLATLRQALGRKEKTDRLRAYAGYAGWGPGQLDQEINRGDWYVAPADAAIVFDTPPPEIWPKLVDRFSGQWTKAMWGLRPLVLGFRFRKPETRD
jgi:putative transcriptional regulator